MTEQRQQEDKSKTIREKQQQTTTTTKYYLPHGAGRVLNPSDLEQVRMAYNSILGDLNAVKARAIEEAMCYGVEASAVIDAIEQTALAPRPSFYYFRAILRRYTNDGITTAEMAKNDRWERRKKQQQEKWRSEEWFEHRNEELPW